MAQEVDIVKVHPALIHEVWDHVYAILHKAIARNDGFEPTDVKNMLQSGHLTLWVAIIDGKLRGALVTQRIFYPRKSTLFLLFMGGTGMREWVGPLEGEIMKYARELGVNDLESLARRGFSSIFQGERTGLEYFRRIIR